MLIGLKTDNRKPSLPLTLFDLQIGINQYELVYRMFKWVKSRCRRIRVYTEDDSLVDPYLVSRIVIFGIMVVTEEVILIDYSERMISFVFA
jgi:hypothetical protein